ncbi:MAG: tyrosine-type recombinase/integrase [Verrucomicrobia bacterium]|nr:tyrosine-type recombinase/integrase [Verrucomicrobiota bacterium]
MRRTCRTCRTRRTYPGTRDSRPCLGGRLRLAGIGRPGPLAAATLCPHPRTGRIACHHLHEASMQRQFKLAVRKAAIPKPATSHCTHCVATHLLQSGTDIRTVQDLMGHTRVETTMIYLHVMQRPGAGGPSPLDIP